LISSGHNLELRFDLSLVSQGFKNMSISYNIPVITVTQLNRSGYDDGSEPSLTQMSESMDKVNYADCIIFLNLNKEKTKVAGHTKYKYINITMLKQRNGPIGLTEQIGMPLEYTMGKNIFSFTYANIPTVDVDTQNREIVKKVNQQDSNIFESESDDHVDFNNFDLL
jgi:replicative DNA helicase